MKHLIKQLEEQLNNATKNKKYYRTWADTHKREITEITEALKKLRDN